jgi:hypothetical protein
MQVALAWPLGTQVWETALGPGGTLGPQLWETDHRMDKLKEWRCWKPLGMLQVLAQASGNVWLREPRPNLVNGSKMAQQRHSRQRLMWERQNPKGPDQGVVPRVLVATSNSMATLTRQSLRSRTMQLSEKW